MKGFVFCVVLALACVNACKNGEYWGNPNDCTAYFQCVNSKPQEMYCSPGLYWNEQIKNCDYPENSECKETSDVPTEGTTKEPTQKPTQKPTEAPTKGTTSSTGCQCPPKDDPNKDVLCSNPEDCGSFFKCYRGKPVLIKCPPGQEWAAELERCDWPSIANCPKSF